MKTERFTIAFDSLDTTMCREMQITKAEYKRQLSYLLQMVKETADREYPVEYRAITHDLEKMVITQHIFTIGTSDTTITAHGCKPGYCFK